MRLSTAMRVGPWLICGGLIILAAYHLLSLPTHSPTVDTLAMTGGAVLGYAILGTGIYLMTGFNRSTTQPAPVAPSSTPLTSQTPRSHDTSVDRVLSEYARWLDSAPADDQVWPAFDQLVREVAATYLRAARVRCYRVSPDDDTLRSLASDGCGTERHTSARRGILGHVAMTGRPFITGDLARGELVHELASEADEQWQLVWPIRNAGATIGLVAIGELPPVDVAYRGLCETTLRLTEMVWNHMACRAELIVARSTDKATGVLTRERFFAAASESLTEAYAENEPTLLAVLSLEGLRGLDDDGAWEVRDALVERTGHELARRTRSDDIVGRFSDERFVMLLRRLDSGLGRLIARKLIQNVQAVIAERGAAAEQVSVRMGLAGSGFGQIPLDDLLVTAFEATERARHEDENIWVDVDTAGEQRARA